MDQTITRRSTMIARSALVLPFVFLIADAMGQLSVPYTASGTYQVPPGVSQVTVECWGGGGRGGARSTNGVGGGGGGGAYARSVVPVSVGNYAVTVGAGSSSGFGPGGNSWFGTTATIFAVGGSSVPDNSSTGAPGGSAGACIGDVVHGGGAGANGTLAQGGGGGGSSAGTAANGNNGSTPIGAVAPAGGGNGGNGRSGTQGQGLAGAAPGGGGGGALRTSTLTRAGGNGGSGLVVVTMPYAEGTCFSSTGGFNSIVDNGCVRNAPTRIALPQSGLPAVLGTGAGNARLLSVELIVSHTRNADLDIRLTSPSGQTRDLVLDRFSTGVNLGNPSNCPSAAFILQDGGAALSNVLTNNVVGTFAPEQTLAGFTGDPNGTWTVTICDDSPGLVGHVRYVRLNFCTVPEITATSSNSPVCSNATLNLNVTATGTAPLSYAWTGVGTFNPNNAVQAPAVSDPATGNYSVTVSNSCGSASASIPVSVTPGPNAAISYPASPFCNTPGTALVVLTGASGGTFSSTPGLSINAATGSVDLGASSPGTYTVTYTIPAAGVCAEFQTTTLITVTPVPSASISYPGSPYCSGSGPATVTLTGTSGGLFSATPAGLSINAATGTVDPGASVPGTYTVNYDVAPAGGCAAFSTSTSITITGCTYYSQGNGAVNSAIWSTMPVGTPIVVNWDSSSSMVIQTGDTVTVNGNTSINDLTTEATSRLLIDNEQLLTVHGDQLTLAQFSISALQGEVELVSPSPVNINVTGTVAFNNLTVNTPAGTTMTGGVNIFGTLLLADGDLNATAATVQLRSDATRTGRLGPVAAGSDFIGDLTVQRYIPGGATNWRLLGSPVAGATVNGWQDDFITAGYPGSQFPNFQDPPGSGNLWPSIRWYDETNTFANVDSGLVGVSSNLQSLAQGQGFAVWCGSSAGGTSPFLIDITGAPHIALAPIQLPMTFTNTGNPTIDGWNLVSNPLPSPVRFSGLARTNVGDYITYYNPATGNSAVYDISLGFGLNGATDTIQTGQAFWLKATASSPGVEVEEGDKVAGNQGGLFGGDQVPRLSGLRLAIGSDLNTYSDETLIVFADGTPAIDGHDVPKVVVAHPAAPQIGTHGPGNELLAINAFGAYASDITIPVMVKVGVSGTYTVTVSTLGPLGLTCVTLEDLSTGTVVPIGDGAQYAFSIEADADPGQVRFLLHAKAPLPFNTLDATCANTPNGQASVEVPQGPVEVIWTDAFGNVLHQQTVGAGTTTLGGLQAGSYAVQVSAQGACSMLELPFTIAAPFELEAVATVSNASCPNVADGALDLMVLGGTAPYAFVWSNGSTTEDLLAGPGVYTVTVTDANGCAWSSDGLSISSGDGPDAEILPVPGTLVVGQEHLFQAAVVDNVIYTWDMGDGTVAQGAELVHAYTLPGIYTVTMVVDDGLCMASSTIDITVELSTGISGQDRNVFRAWQMHDQLVVELGSDADGRAVVDLLDATGQLIMQRTAAAKTERIFLPAHGLASGVYFIRVTAGPDQRTLRVPVVH